MVESAGDALVVETRPLDIRAASVRLGQRILRGPQLLSDAVVRVGFVGPDGRPRRQPEPWRRLFADHFSQRMRTDDPA